MAQTVCSAGPWKRGGYHGDGGPWACLVPGVPTVQRYGIPLPALASLRKSGKTGACWSPLPKAAKKRTSPRPLLLFPFWNTGADVAASLPLALFQSSPQTGVELLVGLLTEAFRQFVLPTGVPRLPSGCAASDLLSQKRDILRHHS